MKLDSDAWSQIVTAFKTGPENGFLTIGENSISVSKNESTKEVEYFKKSIGENRYNRICKQFAIKKDTSFNKETLHKLFLGLMDIRKEDVEELSGTYEDRYRQLLIFDDFDQLQKAFLKTVPSIDSFNIDKVQTSGKGERGLAEKIVILAQHHFKIIQDMTDESHQYRDVELLTSRLGDREMEKGSVVHLQDGLFYVDEVFVGGGAYIAILRDFEDTQTPKLVCRGTAMRSNATEGLNSGINDILLEIGSMGVKAVWPKITKYLSNNSIGKVEILGKSLGGAHAQELAILIEGLHNISVEKLTTYCSVGVGRMINRLFEKKVLAKRTSSFAIHVIRNGVDYVPAVGGEHLGTGIQNNLLDIKVSYISLDQSVPSFPLRPGIFERMTLFAHSFGAPHTRQTTLKQFYWKVIKDDVDSHLKVGNHLESVRQLFASIIHMLTFFQLNGSNFKSYYETLTQN